MAFIEVHNFEDLRLGLFVKIEGSWFSHPFRTNTFKIKSSEDLETIKNLKKVKILYDPDRSESEDSLETSNDRAQASVEVDEEVAPDEGMARPRASSHDESAGKQKASGENKLEKKSEPEQVLDRRHNYLDFREHMRKVEGSYQKVLGQNEEFFSQVHKGKAKGLKVAEDIVAGIQQTLANPQSAMSLIDVMGSNGVMWGLSEHALNVCMLSLLIGKQMGLSTEKMLRLGVGGLLHDVGYRLMPMKVKFLSQGMKVQADLDQLKDHPGLSHQLVAHLPGADEVLLDIIVQHHERLDGSGYPKHLQNDEISNLAKIVMVADRYDELCNAPDPESSLIPHDALSRLFRHVIYKGESSQFCEHVVQALVQAVGVYPPGSLVELTDGLLGVVTAINIQTPTKPILLLYAPWLCRNDGLVVNLANDASVDIKKAVHPKDLEPSVLAYLSPRRMAMFVHETNDNAPFGQKGRKTKAKVPTLSN